MVMSLSTLSFGQNEVEVKGTLKNQLDMIGIGQSSRLEATDASGLLITDLANDTSSMSSKSIGSGSASGFESLSIRHQDAKNTEVWLDGYLIDDPLTNFPLALNLDLASLGFIKIHQGPGPLSLASSSTAGSLEIISSKRKESSFLGYSLGDIYGESFFGRIGSKTPNLSSSLYLRSHKSSGVYPFYYDNLTPYNRDDDTIKKRTSNQSFSNYGLLRASYDYGWHKLNFLAIKEQTRSKIPTPNNSLSLALTTRSLDMTNLMYQFGPEENQVQLGILTNQSHRETKDPYRRVLANSNRETIETTSLKKNIGYFHNVRSLRLNLQATQNETKIDQKEEASQNDFTRSNTTASSGIEAILSDTFTIRSKVRNTWIQDQKKLNLVQKNALDSSLSLLAQAENRSFWLTVAYQDRPPSLLEIFGSPSSVLGNPNLKAETSRLWELGINLQGEFWKGSIAIHHVTTTDKILFVRAGSNALKGQNTESSQLRGVAISAVQDLYPMTLKQSIYLSNTVDRNFKKGLPFEPWALATMGVEWRVSNQTTSGAEVHYKSEYFRDALGDSISPQSAQVDTFIRYAWNPWDVALNINNLGNEMSQKFVNKQSGETGQTAVSDYEGHPLPGRQIRLSTMYRF